MKQTVSINRNKHEIDRIAINRKFQLIAINMKQTDSINRNKIRQIEFIAINMKQTESINRNKHETGRLN